MIRYTHDDFAAVRADAMIVEVDCLGNTDGGLWPWIHAALPDVALRYADAFRHGDVEPGSVIRLDRDDSSPKFVFLFPTRVHSNGEVRPQFVDPGLDRIVHEMLERGAKSVAFGPMGGDRGLDWPEVRRRLLFAFARVPDIELIGLLPPETPSVPVTIFTDGGAEPNPGRGGFGVVLRFGRHRKELHGGFQHTSNDRMELLAAIEGLEALKQPCRVHLHSDSRYVVDMVNQGVLFRIAARDWKKTKAKNIDLWRRFLETYLKHDVELVWVKGHSGIEENERCDALATAAIKGDALAVDHGFGARRKPRPSAKPSVAQPANSTTDGKPAGVPSPSKPRRRSHNKSIATVSLKLPKRVGDLCHHCQRPLVKRTPSRRNPATNHRFSWYLFCEGCRRFYHPEEPAIRSDADDS